MRLACRSRPRLVRISVRSSTSIQSRLRIGRRIASPIRAWVRPRRADRPSSPVLLRAGLAVSSTGTLPFHQVEPALEQVGMRGEPVSRRRIAGWRLHQLPAIIELTDERAAVLIEMKSGDALVYS